MMRSDISQETLEKLNSLIERAIFEVNQGKISGNKIETLMLVSLKLASKCFVLEEELKKHSKIDNKISSIKKNLEKFSN